MQSRWPKQSTIKSINYFSLNNPWNQCLRDENQAEASNKPKRGFAIRIYKINVESNTSQNYQEAIQCVEKNQ